MRDTTNALRELRDFSKLDDREAERAMDELLSEVERLEKKYG